MYFGNMGGILEFDGSYWRNIAPGVSMLTMIKDKHGRIFGAGINEAGYLDYKENGKTIFVSIIDNEKGEDKFLGNFYDIIEYGDTLYFFSIRGYVLKHFKSTTIILQFPNKFFNASIIENKIFVNTDLGLGIFNGVSILEIPGGDKFANTRLRHFYQMNADSLIAITRTDGLYSLVQGEIARYKNRANDFLIENQVYKATSFSDSILAFGTVGSGVLITDIRGNPLHHINRSGGLQSNDHCAIFFDNRKNVWSGLEYGISCIYNNSPFTQINEQWKLINATVYNILIHNKYFFAGTAQGVYYMKWDQSNELEKNFFDLVPETRGRKVWVLNVFDGDLISTSSNVGTFRLNNFRAELISQNVAKELVSARAGVLVGPIEHGGLGVFEKINGHWRFKKQFNEYPNLKQVVVDKEGNLWANDNDHRVIRLTFNKTFDSITEEKVFDTIPGIASFKGLSVFKLENQVMLGTANGTFGLKGNRFTPCSGLNSATGETFHIQGVRVDTRDCQWIMGLKDGFEVVGKVIITNDSIYKVNLHDVPLKRISDYFIFCFYPVDDENIFFGSSEKVIHFNSKACGACFDSYTILIRSVEAIKPADSLIFGGAFIQNGRLTNYQPANSKPILGFNNNAIRLRYSAIFYEESEKTQYQIKLEDFDYDWSEWTSKTEKEYSYLKEGEYRFCVRAKNVFGIISPIAYYSFKILPPWYRTVYAYTTYVVLFILLVLVIVRISIRRVNMEKERLEKIVAERTAKVVEQKEEIQAQNEALNQQKEEMLAQSEVLMEQNVKILKQNEEITSSIQYASTIQMALLTSKEIIDQIFPENFILYKPLNIVSGDFYWVKELSNIIVIAVADCTGHGVPGAFMSMLGIAFLNEIVRKREVTQASEVLNEMRKEIKLSLGQTGIEDLSRDGMELGLVVIYKDEGIMEFSGANIPLYLFREEKGKIQLTEYKPDNMPLGVYLYERETFTNQRIEIRPNDTLYMFSDGFTDQVGGPENKKFSRKKLVQLLASFQHISMGEQMVLLKSTFHEWAGHRAQIDDILVAGFRIGHEFPK
jgi:serine phosphatase RsbU (regulator of sigma subunit)